MCVPGCRPGMTHGLPGARGNAASTFTAEGDSGTTRAPVLASGAGVTARVSRCFVDYRNGASVEHNVHELVSQRVYGIALGYEDLNDHGELRGDAVLSLLVGKRDVTGEKRIRERDRGYALASVSTLNRMELGEPEEAANERYNRRFEHRRVCLQRSTGAHRGTHVGGAGWQT